MSIALMSLAMSLSLAGSKKLVLIVLCDHANDMGDDAYPSIALIAKKSSLGARQTQIVLRKLEEDGFISVVGNHNGGAPGTTRHYKINVEKLRTGESQCTGVNNAGVNPSAPEGCISTHRRVNPSAETGESQCTQTTLNQPVTINEPSTLRKSAKPSIDFQQVVEIWNDLANELSLPLVGNLSPTRKSHIKARLKECDGLDGWHIALEKVKAAKWMHDGSARNGWRVTFDWVIKSENFTKIMEGNYDGNARNGSSQNQSNQQTTSSSGGAQGDFPAHLTAYERALFAGLRDSGY